MTIVDKTGIWRSLGAIAANQDWVTFPLACTTPYSSFRLVWTPQRLFNEAIAQRQFYYLRQLIFTGSQYIEDSRWRRIYPSESPQIVEVPYPPDLIKDPLPQRQLEIKLRINKKIGNSIYSLWTLEIFEQQVSNVLYPTSPATPGNFQAGGSADNYPPNFL